MTGGNSEPFPVVVSSPGTGEHDVVRSVPVGSLAAGPLVRSAGINVEHAMTLAESDNTLPPILVHRPTMRVIDGMHRLCAAKLLGHEAIQVHFFDGSDEEAFVRAVQANVAHGLPLSLADRTAAAARIVRTHVNWSDRKIAGLVGLSPKTVGAVRVRLSASEEIPQSSVRVGKDGRARRLPARGHSPANDPVHEAGSVSEPVPTQPRGARAEPPISRRVDTVEPLAIYHALCQDPSVRLTKNGRFLLRLLELHFVRASEWDQLIANVPPHQANSVADLAWECASWWRDFAEKVAAQGSDPSREEK